MKKLTAAVLACILTLQIASFGIDTLPTLQPFPINYATASHEGSITSKDAIAAIDALISQQGWSATDPPPDIDRILEKWINTIETHLNTAKTDEEVKQGLKDFLTFQKATDVLGYFGPNIETDSGPTPKWLYTLGGFKPANDAITNTFERNNQACIENPSPENTEKTLYWMIGVTDIFGLSNVVVTEDPSLCPTVRTALVPGSVEINEIQLAWTDPIAQWTAQVVYDQHGHYHPPGGEYYDSDDPCFVIPIHMSLSEEFSLGAIQQSWNTPPTLEVTQERTVTDSSDTKDCKTERKGVFIDDHYNVKVKCPAYQTSQTRLLYFYVSYLLPDEILTASIKIMDTDYSNINHNAVCTVTEQYCQPEHGCGPWYETGGLWRAAEWKFAFIFEVGGEIEPWELDQYSFDAKGEKIGIWGEAGQQWKEGDMQAAFSCIRYRGPLTIKIGEFLSEPITNHSKLVLKELLERTGENSLTVLESFGAEHEGTQMNVIAISPASFCKPDSFEAVLRQAMVDGIILGFLGPREPFPSVSETGEVVNLEHFVYWIEIPEVTSTSEIKSQAESELTPEVELKVAPKPDSEPEPEVEVAPVPPSQAGLTAGELIMLDRERYSPFSRVPITIEAPDLNTDEVRTDVARLDITILPSSQRLADYRLVETGWNTGIFTGYISLEGPAGKFGGSGPKDGVLPAKRGDELQFEFHGSKVTVPIDYTIGKILWDKSSYEIGEEATVTLIDPDLNRIHEIKEKAKLALYIGSIPVGEIELLETDSGTGEFTGTLTFREEGAQLAENEIAVEDGDEIYAGYVDDTMPLPNRIVDERSGFTEAKEVFGKTLIGLPEAEPQPTPIPEPEPSEDEGKLADISVAMKHKKKLTLVSVRNNGDEEIFGVQLKIDDGKIRYVKARGWDRDRIDQSTIVVQTTDRPLKPGKSLIMLLIVDKPDSSFEWTALDSAGNVMGKGDIRSR